MPLYKFTLGGSVHIHESPNTKLLVKYIEELKTQKPEDISPDVKASDCDIQKYEIQELPY